MIKEVEILLVEDNVYDAEMTIRALKRVNLANKLVHLQDGEEAINFLFGQEQFAGRDINNTPKVILLDIKMPKVDGIEVLRRIKANQATRMIPVVIMTSSKEEQDIVTSYSFGVNSYVVKPVEFEGFAKAVSELGMYWLLTNEAPLLNQ
jgi:two-component system, response regulator